MIKIRQKMLIQAVVDLFRYKLVSRIIILTCWPPTDRVNLASQFSLYGMMTSFCCNCDKLADIDHHIKSNRLYGVLYIRSPLHALNEIDDTKHFSHWYKWLILEEMPDILHNTRYDADVMFVRTDNAKALTTTKDRNVRNVSTKIFIDDVYMHPRDGVSLHPWAYWSESEGLNIMYERQKILRRLDMKKYPLRIAAPLGQYSTDWYRGTFKEYLLDRSMPERDSGVRCAYGASALLVEALNATEVLIGTKLWSTEVNNSSMLLMLSRGTADLGGGVLRILPNRVTRLDYALSIWPFRVGFTYVAERQSSKNMFIAPFTAGVWLTCLGIISLLAMAQKITASSPEEKEGAYVAVIATYLQQDASAVPEGVSGRWTFIVMSVSSMLIHAYYTSAIVSALMSTGRSSPNSLKSLADSKYAIASEDYDYMRYLMFDVETNWDDLEYLKKKKLTSKFYTDIEKGVELIGRGNTAFHTEYNQLYPHLKALTDDQLCKLQYVDTIPESMTWVTTTKRGQWTDILRSKGGWLRETGLAKRLLSHIRIKPPPCRASLLAERVKFGDVGPVLTITTLGAAFSFTILCFEIIVAKWNRKTKRPATSIISDDSIEEITDISDSEFL